MEYGYLEGVFFSKTVFGGSVDVLLHGKLYFITMKNNVIYNLTLSGNVIRRYVEVMPTLCLGSLAFYAHLSTFSDITLVFELITFLLMADLYIMIISFI